MAGQAAAADGFRAGLPGGGPGDAGVHIRGTVAQVRGQEPDVDVPAHLPKQPDWNKRLRAALPLVKKAIRMLGADTDYWFDDHRIVDSTPVECGRSRPTVKRSDLAGWAGYGY